MPVKFQIAPVGEVMNVATLTTTLSELVTKKAKISDPLANTNHCPFKHEQKVPKFLGFRLQEWKNEKSSGYSISLEFDGISLVSLASFVKSEDFALDDDGDEKRVENANEGVAAIVRKYSTVTDTNLHTELYNYFSTGEHHFVVTEYAVMWFGRKQRRHLINII